MQSERNAQIDLNYDFFQRSLASLLPEHRGEFALIRDREIIGFFAGPGDAYREGLKLFPDELFSVQEVEDRPAEMGLISLAID